MKFGTKLLAIAFLLFSAFVPLRSAPVNELDIAHIRAAIEAGNLKFGEPVRKGDAAAIAALYSEDATLMPPDSDPIQGKETIQAYFSGGLQMGIKDAVLTRL
ncbi:MAG: DUF4440 domain-containing protein [Candidatus Aminicenantes bacterium]|nr:DUF4440 domain-containing protein [Candidatus Aminicenantes bacterium]